MTSGPSVPEWTQEAVREMNDHECWFCSIDYLRSKRNITHDVDACILEYATEVIISTKCAFEADC